MQKSDRACMRCLPIAKEPSKKKTILPRKFVKLICSVQ